MGTYSYFKAMTSYTEISFCRFASQRLPSRHYLPTYHLPTTYLHLPTTYLPPTYTYLHLPTTYLHLPTPTYTYLPTPTYLPTYLPPTNTYLPTYVGVLTVKVLIEGAHLIVAFFFLCLRSKDVAKFWRSDPAKIHSPVGLDTLTAVQHNKKILEEQKQR